MIVGLDLEGSRKAEGGAWGGVVLSPWAKNLFLLKRGILHFVQDDES